MSNSWCRPSRRSIGGLLAVGIGLSLATTMVWPTTRLEAGQRLDVEVT